MLDYRGFFINLDRSSRRRELMEKQFIALGVSNIYARVVGVDARALGIKGFLGCFRAHVQALRQAYVSGAPLVHIVEDDVQMSAEAVRFLSSERAVALARRFDIVYLDMWVDPDNEAVYREACARARLTEDYSGLVELNMASLRIGAMASYVLARDKIPKVLWFLNLPNAQKSAVDAVLNFIVREGGLTAATILPFLTTIDRLEGAESLIQVATHEAYGKAIELRRQFFVDEAPARPEGETSP